MVQLSFEEEDNIFVCTRHVFLSFSDIQPSLILLIEGLDSLQRCDPVIYPGI